MYFFVSNFILNLFEDVFINRVCVLVRACARARVCVCECLYGSVAGERSIGLCRCMDVVK